MRLSPSTCVVVLVGLAANAALAASELRPAEHVDWDAAVPMRDGVVLKADVVRPAAEGRFPTLVYRTPYGKHVDGERYTTFRRAVERGYAVVIQDVRGRYASEGTFDPYRNEGRDGFDTIEWAARQPWCDGRIGTFGLSYPGAVQWLAAMEQPPHLRGMVPAMTFSTARRFIYAGGAFDLSWIAWTWFNIAPDLRARAGLPGPRDDDEVAAAWQHDAERMASRLPLRGLPDLAEVAPFYDAWLSHPPEDAFWDFAELRDRYERVQAAVLNLSGWHDEMYGPEGAITNFLGLRAARAADADARTELILGPWAHGVASPGQTRFGERDFGTAAAIDYDAVVLDFLDRHVRGVPGPTPKPVRVFVMGAGAWREGSSWPPEPSGERPLYLSPGEGGCGRLNWSTPTQATASRFVSDPSQPLVDPHAAAGFGAHDYRALVGREDAICFETEPLERPLDVVGPVRAEVHASADARDFDLWLKLFDVATDGTAWNLWSPGADVQRASLEGEVRRSVEPGQIATIRFDRLATANRFEAGHRLRVVLSGAFAPHFSRNLQTGESEVTSSRTQRASIRIHHGPEHLSRLTLTLVEPGSALPLERVVRD